MRFCSIEITNIRVTKVYMERVIIWGRNRCFAWMDSRQTRGNKRNRSLWGKNSKVLVTSDQPQGLVIKKGCFKAWLFTLNSSILSLQTYFERNRKLRQESSFFAHAYTIATTGESPTAGILNCSSWFSG